MMTHTRMICLIFSHTLIESTISEESFAVVLPMTFQYLWASGTPKERTKFSLSIDAGCIRQR